MKAHPTVDKIIEARELRPGMLLYDEGEVRLVVDAFPVEDYDVGGRYTRLCVRLADKAILLKPTTFCTIQEPIYDDPFAGL